MSIEKQFNYNLRGTPLSINYNIYNSDSNKYILSIHGSLTHGKAYNDQHVFLQKNGYNVYAIDLIGHGLSSGQRGAVDIDNMLNLLVYFTNKIIKKRVTLLGHSTGGLLAILLSDMIKTDKIIVTNPFLLAGPSNYINSSKNMLDISGKIPYQLLFLIYYLTQPLKESLIVRFPGDIIDFTSEKKNIKNILGDPLHIPDIPVVSFISVIGYMDFLRKNISSIKKRIVIIQSKKDKIADMKGATMLNKSNKVHLHIFEEGFHELHNEKEHIKNKYFKTLLEYL